LHNAEEQLVSVEAALGQRTAQVTALQSRLAEVESELEGVKHEQRRFGSAFAAKDRDSHRKIESLQDEVEHLSGQVVALEKMLKERTGQLAEARERLGTAVGDKEEAEKILKEREKRTAEEKQVGSGRVGDQEAEGNGCVAL
jgi:predicted  nucleic acid-binding Zn-ribbon protein